VRLLKTPKATQPRRCKHAGCRQPAPPEGPRLCRTCWDHEAAHAAMTETAKKATPDRCGCGRVNDTPEAT